MCLYGVDFVQRAEFCHVVVERIFLILVNRAGLYVSEGPFTSCLKNVRPSTAMIVGWQFT